MSYNICKRCCMDSTAKEFTPTVEGCNFCEDAIRRFKQLKISKLELPWIINEIKKEGKCLLGLSGGVDSSMCLHYLLEQGIKPITFSLDNSWEDVSTNQNIKNLVEKANVTHYLTNLGIEPFRELQNAYRMSGVPNIEVPTDHILMANTYKLANDLGIKYIISGGNIATESIMPPSWSWNARDCVQLKAIFKKFTGKKIDKKQIPTISVWKYIYYRFIKKIKIVNLLDYYEYDRKKSIELLKKEYDYLDYGDKHEENPFTQWFQNYYLPKFHNIDKRKAHYSSLICSGQMTRDEALDKLSKPAPYQDLKLKVYPPKPHTDYPSGEKWWKLASLFYRKVLK